MGWASNYIERLKAGETVTFRPRGHSMRGLIEDGQEVTVVPCDVFSVEKGDVVLCTVNGRDYLHKVISPFKKPQCRVAIGNNVGGFNGWTTKVYGKVVW